MLKKIGEMKVLAVSVPASQRQEYIHILFYTKISFKDYKAQSNSYPR